MTLATIVTGHISLVKGLAYILMQLCGAVFGILLVVSSPLLFTDVDLLCLSALLSIALLCLAEVKTIVCLHNHK